MESSTSKQERISAAADKLYEAAGRSAFPTVDAVRKIAKASMNDACTGMKEWRRKQTAQVDLVAVEVPSLLKQAATQSLQSLWEQAMSTANEALRAAQASWQQERSESDAICAQMADAFEVQEHELHSRQADLDLYQSQSQEMASTIAGLREQSEQLMHDNVVATAAAEQARALLVEVEKRANDMHRERDQAYVALTDANNRAAELRRSAEQDLAASRTAVEQLRQQMSIHGAEADRQVIAAKEEAAELRGALAALQKSPTIRRPRRGTSTANVTNNLPGSPR